MEDGNVPDRREIERLYREDYRPLYEEFAARLHALLEMLVKDTGIPVDHIEHRVKTIESFMEKIECKSYADPFQQIKDCLGLRIVTFYQDSVKNVVNMLREEFEVDEANSLDKIEDLADTEFGYRSVHLIVSLSPQRAILREWKRYAGLPAEIQIRSVLQHAWATVSHTLNYKSTAQESRKVLRQLSRLSAHLETVDEEFIILRDNIQPETTAAESGEASQTDRSAQALTMTTLQDFVKHTADLQKWERFGVRAGMRPFPKLISKHHATGLHILLLTLQTVGITNRVELETLMPELETHVEPLQRFVELVTTQDEILYAVPVDVLTLLVSFARASALPPEFDWGGMYEPFFVEALRTICRTMS
jgi:putative GTP pyrophosphokinase